MKIVIVCGAGASSTFVAAKLRTAAATRGIDVSVSAEGAAHLDSLKGIDVLLVGAHLESSVPALRERAAHTGTAVAILPPGSPATLDAARVLDLALTARPAAL